MNLTVKKIQFRDHNGELRDKIEGQRVLLLMDDQGIQRAELVWRIASGYTVEICEFFIHREEDQRQGWGTRLLNEAIADMKETFKNNTNYPGPLRLVWVLAERTNRVGRPFYEKSGFEEQTILKKFYDDGDAVLYVRRI